MSHLWLEVVDTPSLAGTFGAGYTGAVREPSTLRMAEPRRTIARGDAGRADVV
jgi:hypothetical protein